MYKPQLSQPIRPSERIEIVDIVRGFALFGVLLVNMLSFSGPYLSFEPWTLSVTFWDRIVELIILTLGQGAFYSIFSILFGLSYALQINRAKDRDEYLQITAKSRMKWLLIFGMIHLLLIWDGDILVIYATSGFFLSAFADTGAKKTLNWASGFLLFFAASFSLMTLAPDIHRDWFREATAAEIAIEIEKFRTGTFTDLVFSRLDELLLILGAIICSVPWFLGLFLVGLWAVKSGKLANWRNERAFLVSVLKISLPMAIASKGFLAYAIIHNESEYVLVLSFIIDYYSSSSLGVTYICLIGLFLQQRPQGGHFLRHLAPVGRMALTNYLAQSLLAVFFFYGLGFGQYGRLGLGVVLLLSLFIFAAQIAFSRAWLDRFQFGPMEWLWRVLTYKTRIG